MLTAPSIVRVRDKIWLTLHEKSIEANKKKTNGKIILFNKNLRKSKKFIYYIAI